MSRFFRNLSGQMAVAYKIDRADEAPPVKINAAEKTIAAWQRAEPHPDAYERIAIRDVLQALGVLIAETWPKQSERGVQRKDIA